MNEPFSDAMNNSNIDFVYHLEPLARITEELPAVSSTKHLKKPFVIPGRVCVLHPMASLLSIKETHTVWEVREWFNIKGEQRIDGPPARA